jgi:hypothetical protein
MRAFYEPDHKRVSKRPRWTIGPSADGIDLDRSATVVNNYGIGPCGRRSSYTDARRLNKKEWT